MSWAALPVEPACMGKVGEGTRRPPMFVGLAEQIKLQCSDIIKVKITIGNYIPVYTIGRKL